MDSRQPTSRSELCALLGIQDDFVVSLEREEIVTLEEGGYSQETIERVRVCWSLHQELGVNLPGLEVCLGLMDRIRRERTQFREVLTWLGESFREPQRKRPSDAEE
ncbi:MAG: chaperone modulator CbpM [Planctomycetota bacterium]|jgi:hypothetical protein